MNFDQLSAKKTTEEISEEGKTFQQYVEDLKLNPEDFKKVILDVGAGEAHFAKWARDNNISSQIYSLEPFQKMAEREKGLIGNAEEIPALDASFDLVVSNGAIPNIYLGEKNAEEKIKKSFYELLRILKSGGEIRLARVLFGEKYENQKVLTDSVQKTFKELQEKYNIKIDKIRTPLNDSYEYDKNGSKKGILAKSFLIILQKPKSNNGSSSVEQKTTKDKWEEILSKFPEKLQKEFRIERPNPDQDDIEMFESVRLLESIPVEIPISELLEKNKDVVYRTPPDVFDEINQKYYKMKLNVDSRHFHEQNPNRLRAYGEMPAETADPSVLLDGEIWFGTGRFVAALLRGDNKLRVWNLSRK